MPMGDVVQGSFRGGLPRLPTPAPSPSRAERGPVSRHMPGPPGSGPGPAVPRIAQGRIDRAAGTALSLPPSLNTSMGQGGQRLPEAVQRKMEAVFGASFADVRVHVGGEAPAIGAQAFTCGNHLYFAPGQYDPKTPHGQRLLGHELTHVVQQRAGRVRNPFGSGIAIVQEPALEAEAERMGLRAASLQASPEPNARRSAGSRQPTPPRRAPAPAQASSGIQCKPVKLRNPGKEDEEYLALIADYEKLQQYLTDHRCYLPALKALNEEVEEQINRHGPKRALSSVLLRREQQYGINSQGAPIYTTGLSGRDFNRMLQEAVIPKDVGELSRHGEQTHRIQWYIILWNMYRGFKTTDHKRVGFNFSARDLLIKSTKVQVPRKNFPVLLDRGANVWHALFDMALDVPSSREYVPNEHDWREDVLTSADLLGGALHGDKTHMANRQLVKVRNDRGWKATGRTLRETAPTVSKLLAKNYAKRLDSETELGQGKHLEDYHRRKLESGRYKAPSWSGGGILIVRHLNPTVKQVIDNKVEPPPYTPRVDTGYFFYLEHLLFNHKWDQEGTGFLGFGTKTPDGVVKMRDACRKKRYWDVFRIAEAKLLKDDSYRTPLVKDLYEALAGIWNGPWRSFNTLLREMGSWDIGK
jgi:hypothetical protein